jgi:hypothetical protein
VDARVIKSTGSKVRCSKCRHVFVTYPAAAAVEAEETLTLDDELSAPDVAQEASKHSEIDAKLDMLFKDDAFGQAADAPAEQEPELPDLSGFLAEDPLTADAFTTEKLGDDLDLDVDLGFSPEGDQADEDSAENMISSVTDDSPESDSEEMEIDFNLDIEPSEELPTIDELPLLEGEELSLEEIDLLEEPEPAGGAPVDGPADAEGAEAEPGLDLESLDLDATDTSDFALDEPVREAMLHEVSDGTGEGAGPAGGQVNDMNFELEAEMEETVPSASEDVAAGSRAEDEDELDLSDLEALLGSDGAAAVETPDAMEDIDLNLDLESVMAEEGEASGDTEEIDFEAITAELETDAAAVDISSGPESEEKLELDLETSEGVSQAADSETDELDFTEITAMLDREEPAPGDTEAAETTDDLGLVFDEEPEAALQPTPPADGSQDELTLDIETLLENGAEKPAEAVQTDFEAVEEVDLDQTGEPAPAEADDIEIEIEPVSDETEAELAAAATAAAAAVAVSAPSGETEAATDEIGAETFTDSGLAGATDVLESEAEAPIAQETAPSRRSGFRRLMVAALGMLVLAIAAIVIPRSLGIHIPYLSDVNIPYLSELDIEIPFIGKIFQSAPEDADGNLKISPLAPSITAEFITNPQAGKLCVLTGMVRNNYDHPRNFIQVTGKLYTRDKKMAKSLTGYAGTVLTREELTGLDPATIASRLKSKSGLNNRNVGVNPGATVPFMLVFDQLPDNLDEYSVEVASSSK